MMMLHVCMVTGWLLVYCCETTGKFMIKCIIRAHSWCGWLYRLHPQQPTFTYIITKNAFSLPDFSIT